MHLKRLIIHGFKSFADRTEFEFRSGGLTCIVGPNGCGKSNVLDAVKWVLGEQRPTSLRGKEMTDVVFNGTVRRPPMGLCEGTLVFDNACRTLPVDEPEVRVTRRVFRTGETEYLVNGRPGRLKDIRDLFAGTGLGVGGYAFMEQGKIDSILAGNAVERRKVFEEAAGISRFRARKHETELKLQKVEENLTRLADVVEEINRQIRSLKIHAGKARNHRELTARLKDLQRRLSLHRHAELEAARLGIEQELAELGLERDDLQKRRDEARSVLGGVEAELEGVVNAVSEARTGYAEVSGHVTNTRQKIGFHERYLTELADRASRKDQETESNRASLETLREEQVLVARERDELERDLVRIAGRRSEEEQQVTALRERGVELDRQRAAAEATLRRIEQALAELSKREARREAEIGHLDHRCEAFRVARGKAEAERDELRRGLDERTGRQGAQATVLEERRAALVQEEHRSEELERAHSDSAEALRRLEADLGRLQARKDVLHGLLKRREGLDEGTKGLLDRKARRPEFLPGFRGLLLDLFEVDLAEARAVEAALGDAATALVVASGAEALEGLAALRERGHGGALFLPLDRFHDVELRPLNGLRPSSPEIARVLSALVGGIEVVPRAEFEARLREDGPGAPLLVTAEGEVMKDGRLVSCARGGDAAGGLVVLQAELKGLERRVPGLVEQQAAGRAALDAARAARDASRARVKELSVALVKEEGDAARLDQEIVRLVREVDRLLAEEARLAGEVGQTTTALENARADLAALRETRHGAEAELAKAHDELARHRDGVLAHKEEQDGVVQSLNAARIEEAKTKERLDAVRSRGGYLQSAALDLGRRIEAAGREVEQIQGARVETAEIVRTERDELSRLEAEALRTAETLREREAEADLVRDRLREVQEHQDAIEAELNERIEALSRRRGREGELRAAMDALVRHTMEELSLDLNDRDAVAAAWTAVSPPAPAPDPAPATGEAPTATDEAGGAVLGGPEASTPDAAAAPAAREALAEMDWGAVEVEVKELKERIARLGNVNLAAVEELEEAEKRAEFIFRERADLEQSREQLRKVLKSIEEQSTKLFLDTFNAVREHFVVIFRKLFGGGRADMRLEVPEQPLESGIEVTAQPPGKEVKSITQLSGGERSMTAVALLFAIFRAHPAPCAFMDEVDAALDEDNTERFVRLVEDSRQQAQFIVVTHSKRTMEHADLLYGVTMPERGVSRRVAVRLEQMDDQGRIRDLDAVNREAARLAAAEALAPGGDDDAAAGRGGRARRTGGSPEEAPAPSAGTRNPTGEDAAAPQGVAAGADGEDAPAAVSASGSTVLATTAEDGPADGRPLPVSVSEVVADRDEPLEAPLETPLEAPAFARRAPPKRPRKAKEGGGAAEAGASAD